MPTLYLLLAAVLGPLLIGGLTYGYEDLWDKPRAIAAAVADERARGDQICAGKVAAIGQKSAEDALASRDAADAAVADVKPLSDDKVARKAMCDADQNCRQRGLP